MDRSGAGARLFTKSHRPAGGPIKRREGQSRTTEYAITHSQDSRFRPAEAPSRTGTVASLVVVREGRKPWAGAGHSRFPELPETGNLTHASFGCSQNEPNLGEPAITRQFEGSTVYRSNRCQSVRHLPGGRDTRELAARNRVRAHYICCSFSRIQVESNDEFHGDVHVDEEFLFSLDSETKQLNKPTYYSGLANNSGPRARKIRCAEPVTTSSGTKLPPGHSGDSKPEAKPPESAEASDGLLGHAALLSGLALALLVALAMLMVRSSWGRFNGLDQSHSDLIAGGEFALPEASPAGAALSSSLAATDGSHQIPLDRGLLLSPEGLVIGGTLEMCHVEIREPQVAHRHVRIRLVRGGLWIEDLNSSTGTEVDGTALEPYMPLQVSPGQVLQIGTRSYELQAGKPPAASTA